jgi:phosphate transport system substrate-binding protein
MMPVLSNHMHTTLKSLALVALTVTAVNAQAADTVSVDPKIPAYAVASGVSGNLNSVGSDTLNNLMTFWSEGFKAQYPNVKIQVEGKGSGTAPVALASGVAQVGPMSREMKSTEINAFAAKFGHKPTRIPVAIDALAVFVHKDNAVKGLSLKQVDGIFASTRKRGGQDVVTWGDLGQKGALAGKTVSAFGRNSASGTYGYFKEVALKGGDFKDTIKEQPGSSSVVQGIAADVGAIGYSGIGYATSGVRALPLSTDDSGSFVEPTYANCLNGSYPLSRYLYVYVNKAPSKPMDKLTSEFVTFVLSKQGQEIVIKDGYFPLPSDVADEGRASLKYYSAE